MLITAVVNNRGNTLVVELPRDRMDIEGKLRSIGEEFSDRIPISDNPDSVITTRLSAESDIGLHLIKLFNDSHTLKNVNDTLQVLMKAPDEVKEALESDIINDQYSSPNELTKDVKKLTEELGEYTETFYFPIIGNLDDGECGEHEVGNDFLKCYEWDIKELVELEQSDPDLGNMRDYFLDDDTAQAKMVTANWGIEEMNGKLYGKVDFKLREPFTAEEKAKVRDWVIGQNSDGFGEGLEQRPIETEDGDLYVSMWNSSDSYFVYDTDEMNDYLGQNNQERKASERYKPDCELIGQDGNIFNLTGIAARTLRRSGLSDRASEMTNRVYASGSYYEALNIIGEYVNITDGSDDSEDIDDSEGEVMTI
jgi:hypothetical protein